MGRSTTDRGVLALKERRILRRVRQRIFLLWCRVEGLGFNKQVEWAAQENQPALEAFRQLIGRNTMVATVSALLGNSHCSMKAVMQLLQAFQQTEFAERARALNIAPAELCAHAFLSPELWEDVRFSLRAADLCGEAALSARHQTESPVLEPPQHRRRANALASNAIAPGDAAGASKRSALAVSDERRRRPKPRLDFGFSEPPSTEGPLSLIRSARLDCIKALAAVFVTDYKSRKTFDSAVAKIGEFGKAAGITAELIQNAVLGAVHIEPTVLEVFFDRLHLGKDTIRQQLRAEGAEELADLRVFTESFAGLVLNGRSVDDALEGTRTIGTPGPELFRIEPGPEDRPCDNWAHRYGRATVIHDGEIPDAEGADL